MKYIKMLGLAAVAAAALMAFVGASTASATQLTSTDGAILKEKDFIHAENEGKVILDPPFGAIECSQSTVSNKITNAGSSTTTVVGSVEALTFTLCNATVSVLKKGTLEFHTETGTEGTKNNNNGTLTSSGAEVTVEFLGTHCIFSTNNTHLGTVTGYTAAKTLEHHATFHISATIPRTGGSSGVFCGSTAAWTGAYTITTPKTLHID
jgi:hypothetical protein